MGDQKNTGRRRCAGRKKGKGKSVKGPRRREDLKQWVREHLGIAVPDVRICGGHSSPMDYLWHAYRSDDASLRTPGQISGDCIVWANRGGGKTLLAAVATLLEGVLKKNCRTSLLLLNWTKGPDF